MKWPSIRLRRGGYRYTLRSRILLHLCDTRQLQEDYRVGEQRNEPGVVSEVEVLASIAAKDMLGDCDKVKVEEDL
jgi:hypothetical protein